MMNENTNTGEGLAKGWMQPSSSVTHTANRVRVYQAWEGNEKFFCWGVLITGPNWLPAVGTGFIVVAPVVIYLVFVASYMTLQRSAAIMVFSCILPVLSVLFLLLTACSDPGIIPRRQPDAEYLQGRKPRTKVVLVNNHRVVIRYNDTCHFYQPPRAHHCSVNDNCIERFDHHCPWVGTTVGKRNYRSFLLFIYTSTVLCLYAFGNSLASLFVRHSELVDNARQRGESGNDKWGQTIGDSIPAIVIMGYTFLLFWFVGGLSGFHAYLVSTNQTTYETFRYRHEDHPNPYDRGIVANCAEVWCAPIQPSKVRFRAFVDEVGEPDADIEMGGGLGQQQARLAAGPPQVPAFPERAMQGEGPPYSVGPDEQHSPQRVQQEQHTLAHQQQTLEEQAEMVQELHPPQNLPPTLQDLYLKESLPLTSQASRSSNGDSPDAHESRGERAMLDSSDVAVNCLENQCEGHPMGCQAQTCADDNDGALNPGEDCSLPHSPVSGKEEGQGNESGFRQGGAS